MGGLNLVIAHRICNSKRGQEVPTEENLHDLTPLMNVENILLVQPKGKFPQLLLEKQTRRRKPLPKS